MSGAEGGKEEEGALVGAPIIKYAINDAGGLMDYDSMCSWLRAQVFPPATAAAAMPVLTAALLL